MAEWLGRGLQSLVHRFESGSRLYAARARSGVYEGGVDEDVRRVQVALSQSFSVGAGYATPDGWPPAATDACRCNQTQAPSRFSRTTVKRIGNDRAAPSTVTCNDRIGSHPGCVPGRYDVPEIHSNRVRSASAKLRAN